MVNSADGSAQSSQIGGPGESVNVAVAARANLILLLIWIVGIFVTCVGLGLFSLMAVPLAHAIAGKHTDFSVTVSVSLSATLAATTALSSTGLALKTREAKRLKSRNRALEKMIGAWSSTSISGDPGTPSAK